MQAYGFFLSVFLVLAVSLRAEEAKVAPASPLDWTPSDAMAVFSVKLGGLLEQPKALEAIKAWPESDSRLKAFDKGAEAIGVKSSEFIIEIVAWTMDGSVWNAALSTKIPEARFEEAFQPAFEAGKMSCAKIRDSKGRAVFIVEAKPGKDGVARKWAAAYLAPGVLGVCEFKGEESCAFPELPAVPLSKAELSTRMRGGEASLAWAYSNVPVLGSAPGPSKSVNAKASKLPEGLKGWTFAMDYQPPAKAEGEAKAEPDLHLDMALECVDDPAARKLASSLGTALFLFSVERFVNMSSLGYRLYRAIDVKPSGRNADVKAVLDGPLQSALLKWSAPK